MGPLRVSWSSSFTQIGYDRFIPNPSQFKTSGLYIGFIYIHCCGISQLLLSALECRHNIYSRFYHKRILCPLFHLQTEHAGSDGSACDFYSGSTLLKTWRGHRLFWLRLHVVLLSRCPDDALRQAMAASFLSSSLIPRCIVWVAGKLRSCYFIPLRSK
jgi:hypothetical protein